MKISLHRKLKKQLTSKVGEKQKSVTLEEKTVFQT